LDESFILKIVSLLALLILSGIFSGSETALTALGKLRIKRLEELFPEKIPLLSLWTHDPHRILTTILVGNNVVNISASTLAASLSIKYAELRGFTDARAIGLSIGIMTFLILMFGEIIPKIYAQQNPEKITFFALRFIKIFSIVLLPLVKVLTFLSNIVIRAMGGKVTPTTPFLTDQEIRTLIAAAEREKLIEEEEREMIEGVFEFGEKRASDVMVPRIEIFALDIETPLEEVVEEVKKRGFSRIPVYRKNIDNIVGILYARDLLSCIKGKELMEIKLENLIRKPIFVPESKRLDELLQEFKREKTHVAIVVDEYGGTAGLVTLEDVLEEIVGEISDEYDREEKLWEEISPNVYIVDARLNIDTANEELNLNLPKNDFDTVGGFILEKLQKVPTKGEVVEHENLRFIVLDADERRVKRVKVIRLSDEEGKG